MDYLPEKLARTIVWGKTEAPQRIRERLFLFDPAVLGMPMPAPPMAGGFVPGQIPAPEMQAGIPHLSDPLPAA